MRRCRSPTPIIAPLSTHRNLRTRTRRVANSRRGRRRKAKKKSQAQAWLFYNHLRRVYGFKNFDTPPCFEHAPRWLAACEYIPSLHCAIAPVGSLSSPRLVDALVAVFGAAVAVGACDFASDRVRAGDVAGTAAGRLGAAVAAAAGAEPLM